MLESTACLTTLFLAVAASVVGLSCPSSAQVHTLILLRVSGALENGLGQFLSAFEFSLLIFCLLFFLSFHCSH